MWTSRRETSPYQLRLPKSTARPYESAARDELQVAIARVNVEPQYKMNARVQELESHAEAAFTECQLGSKKPNYRMTQTKPWKLTEKFWYMKLAATELTRRDEPASRALEHQQAAVHLQESWKTVHPEKRAIYRGFYEELQNAHSSASHSISRFMLRETDMYSTLQAMQQENSQMCREFEMAVQEQSAIIRLLLETVVQRWHTVNIPTPNRTRTG